MLRQAGEVSVSVPHLVWVLVYQSRQGGLVEQSHGGFSERHAPSDRRFPSFFAIKKMIGKKQEGSGGGMRGGE